MQSVNLLPWRLTLYHQRLKNSVFIFVIILILTIFSYFWLSHRIEANELTLNQYQQEVNQINQVLRNNENKIEQLRVQAKKLEELTEIPANYLHFMLKLLANIPFEQGGLEQFSIENNEIILSGKVFEQSEFEKIHTYLEEQTEFTQVKLTQFKPDKYSSYFEFKLDFNDYLNREKK